MNTPTSERAREIFGNNFFGFEEWRQFYGANFTQPQLQSLARLPWTVEELTSLCPFAKGRRIHETHFAFIGLEQLGRTPLTIMELRRLHPAPGQPQFFAEGQRLLGPQEFEKTKTPQFRWYLLPLSFVPNTHAMHLIDQVQIIPREYDVPLAVEEILKVILYFKKNGIYLNPTKFARCADTYFHGKYAHVGSFGFWGLTLGCWSPHVPHPDVALAASRRPSIQTI